MGEVRYAWSERIRDYRAEVGIATHAEDKVTRAAQRRGFTCHRYRGARAKQGGRRLAPERVCERGLSGYWVGLTGRRPTERAVLIVGPHVS
jgi:hypothetical protein